MIASNAIMSIKHKNFAINCLPTIALTEQIVNLGSDFFGPVATHRRAFGVANSNGRSSHRYKLVAMSTTERLVPYQRVTLRAE